VDEIAEEEVEVEELLAREEIKQKARSRQDQEGRRLLLMTRKDDELYWDL
jgi:hypothetical protein